jgi:hypothetical protein
METAEGMDFFVASLKDSRKSPCEGSERMFW